MGPSSETIQKGKNVMAKTAHAPKPKPPYNQLLLPILIYLKLWIAAALATLTRAHNTELILYKQCLWQKIKIL